MATTKPVVITDDVRRVLAQIVDASCNALARMLMARLQALALDPTVDLQRGSLVEAIRRAGYTSGHNDALKLVRAMLTEDAERRGMQEHVAHHVAALVEVDNER